MSKDGNKICIIRVGQAEIPQLCALFRRDAVESQPENPDASDIAIAGLEKSLSTFDFLNSQSFWIFAAQIDSELVGYVSVVRIPKADARVGFLYVDELWVSKPYRRQGIASALLSKVCKLGSALGMWKIRLLTTPDNQAARKLYEKLGFTENQAIICQKSL